MSAYDVAQISLCLANIKTGGYLGLEMLPQDLLLHIFSLCDPSTQEILARVCTRFQSVISELKQTDESETVKTDMNDNKLCLDSLPQDVLCYVFRLGRYDV